MVRIEKGVPIPNKCANSGNKKYPYESMQVGDSFMIALKKDDYSYTQNQARASAKSASERTGHKYTTRRVEGGVRVWRVE